MDKKKLLNTLFRIFIVLTFFAGVIFIIKFFTVTAALDKSADEEEIVELVGGFAKLYYLYVVGAVVSLVLNFVCFKNTGVIVSVFRTIFLAAATVCALLPIKMMNLFFKSSKIDITDLDEVKEFGEEIDAMLETDAEAIKFVVAVFAVAIFFILAITSIVNLAKKSKKTEDN